MTSASWCSVVETRLGLPEESGRQRPEPIEGSETLIHADAVIVADARKAAMGIVNFLGCRNPIRFSTD